ncbi:hypothetical protein DFH06DRAFT_1487716 [Mycena polygramma]|nr:hypothetical protein DFH06DRAFT_1487716 [Mycena polygramma]
MSGILKLPAELHYEISSMLSWTDKQNLRSACRALNLALRPLILSHLLIDPRRTTLEQLRLLAASSYPGSSFVKSVTVKRFVLEDEATSNDEDVIRALTPMRGALVPAFSALENLQAVRWELDIRDPAEMAGLILDALMSLSISRLEIVAPELLPISVPFHRLRGLRSLSIHLPAERVPWAHLLERIIHPVAELIRQSLLLEGLSVVQESNYTHRGKMEDHAYLHHLMAKIDPQQSLPLNHLSLRNVEVCVDKINLEDFRLLQSLVLELPSPDRKENGTLLTALKPTDIEGLWCGLSHAEIYPPSFRTTAPVDSFALRYLLAHRDLQRLEFTSIPSAFDPSEFDIHAAKFYAEVLPRHTGTLTHLSVFPGREGGWTFDAHNARAILQCQALTYLSIAVSAPWVDFPPDTNDESDALEGSASQMTPLPRVDDTLLLFDVAFELPRLNVLVITMAPDYLGKGGRVCGTGRMRRRCQWRSLIRLTINEYRFDRPSLAKRVAFRLHLDEDGSGFDFSYRLAQTDDTWRFVSIDEPEITGSKSSKGGLGLGHINKSWIDHDYITSLSPSRRLPIEEL